MRRIQLYIDEALDDELEAEAARTNTSKAALIRAAIAGRYGAASRDGDPIDALIGAFGGEAGAAIDDVVYDVRRR
jgi:hypothetical protein